MSNRTGFTLVEAAAVLVAVAVGVSTVAVAIGQPEPEGTNLPKQDPPNPKANDPETIAAEKSAKAKAAQLKDATQVRGIHQGLVMFGQNNNDLFALPSAMDVGNSTVKATGAEKDTTANIISIMIWNGFFSPELTVSPVEVNEKIKVCTTYEYSMPKKAIAPITALWDPAFSADFSDGNTGNVSYAHLIPTKSRRDLWKNTFNSKEPVVGSRGPKIFGVKALEDGSVEPELAGRSNTLKMHGDPESWSGNVAFQDNHVEYKTTMTHAKSVYKDAKGVEHPDVFFYNEPEDETDTNAFLGIFTRAGNSTRNFKPIWD